MKSVPAKMLLVALMIGGGFSSHALLAQTSSGRSPFQPEGTAGPAAPTVTMGAPLELRGIVSTKAGFIYGIFDPTKRQSVWVRMNDSGSDFAVRSHDETHDTVTVDYQGRVMTLALKSAKVESMAPLPSPAQVNSHRTPPMPNQLQPQQPSINPTAADEARRLEGVAAEVRRRRMLRQAAAQNGGQGGPPNMAAPPMPAPQPGAQPLPR